MRADQIALLLPEIYRRSLVPGAPLTTLIEVMEALHAPVESILRDLPDYFDPQHTPDRFVPFLAQWVDLARWLEEDSGTFDTGTGRLRQVIAASAQLSRMRGTAAGLAAALEWAVGVNDVHINEEVKDAAGHVRPFHVTVTLHHSAIAYEHLVRRIVQQEKPAHVTVSIDFGEPDPGAAVPPEPPTSDDAPAADERPTLPVGEERVDTEPAFPGTERIPVVTLAPPDPAQDAPGEVDEK